MKFQIALLILALVSYAQVTRADFVGPSHARQALSADGSLIVRITDSGLAKGKDGPKFLATYYEYDATSDSYVRRSSIPVQGLSQMLYVSNAGDLVLISLGEKESIELHSRDGKLKKNWSLGDFLTQGEIDACIKTGSTLQWLQEGVFFERKFYFLGPSQQIRALQPPFSVMRGRNDKVSFSGHIDAAKGTISKDEQENP